MSQRCSHGRKGSPTVNEAVAGHEAAHPHWREAKRNREVREAQEAEARAQRAVQVRHQEQQQRATGDAEAWCRWVDQRIVEQIKVDREASYDAIGQVISDERDITNNEISMA